MCLSTFRYVDDYLVPMEKGDIVCRINGVLEIFKETGYGFKFTCGMPDVGVIQFLDLKLKFDHICWKYTPHSVKALLDYTSTHSKLIKEGIAVLCLKAVLRKSCPETTRESFDLQVRRLKHSDYPAHLLTRSCEIISWLKEGDKSLEQAKICKVAV